MLTFRGGAAVSDCAHCTADAPPHPPDPSFILYPKHNPALRLGLYSHRSPCGHHSSSMHGNGRSSALSTAYCTVVHSSCLSSQGPGPPALSRSSALTTGASTACGAYGSWHLNLFCYCTIAVLHASTAYLQQGSANAWPPRWTGAAAVSAAAVL
jgi:hypothetical protein